MGIESSTAVQQEVIIVDVHERVLSGDTTELLKRALASISGDIRIVIDLSNVVELGDDALRVLFDSRRRIFAIKGATDQNVRAKFSKSTTSAVFRFLP